MAEGQSVLNQVLEEAGKKQEKTEDNNEEKSDEKTEDNNEERSEPETEAPAEETQEDAGAQESTEEPQKPQEPQKEAKDESPKEEPEKAVEKAPEPKREPERQPDKRPRRGGAAPNVVLVGKKPTMSYVLAVVTQFSDGMADVHIKARGRSISRAVDVAEVVKNRFVQGAKVDVQIGTDEVIDENSNKINVSTIDIKLVK